MNNFNIFMLLLILIFTIYEASALKCWRCSSDTSNSEFCDEILDKTQLTPQVRHWNYIECSPPKDLKNIYGEKMVSKCRIQKQSISGQTIFSRHCVVEAELAASNSCAVRSVFSEVKIIACETCTEDGCNEKFSEKPLELKEETATGSGISTTMSSMQVIATVLGIVWFMF